MIVTEAPCDVIDVHGHIASLAHVFGTAQLEVGDDPTARRVEYLDRHAITAAVVMPSSVGITAHSMRRLNDEAASYRDLRPTRFPVSLATVDPSDTEAALAEIDRAVTELDARGFMWHHHFQGTLINDVRMEPLIDRLQHHGVPAFIHILAESFLESPWRLGSLAHNFPDVEFVALDGFSSGPQAGEMLDMAQRCPNVVFDTGVAISVAHGFDRFIRAVGPERLLFGADYYETPVLFAIPFPLYELLNLGLSDTELELVLGGNAKRLLKIDGPIGG
jgi:predicted TIM-barrel fold metal-dependent hydrolase